MTKRKKSRPKEPLTIGAIWPNLTKTERGIIQRVMAWAEPHASPGSIAFVRVARTISAFLDYVADTNPKGRSTLLKVGRKLAVTNDKHRGPPYWP